MAGFGFLFSLLFAIGVLEMDIVKRNVLNYLVNFEEGEVLALFCDQCDWQVLSLLY